MTTEYTPEFGPESKGKDDSAGAGSPIAAHHDSSGTNRLNAKTQFFVI
jgi:hypothetical protein